MTLEQAAWAVAWLASNVFALGKAWGALRAWMREVDKRLASIEATIVGTAGVPGLVSRVERLEDPAPALPSTSTASTCNPSRDVLDSERTAR